MNVSVSRSLVRYLNLRTFSFAVAALSILSACDGSSSSSHINQVPPSFPESTPTPISIPTPSVTAAQGQDNQSVSFSGGWIGGGGDSLRLRFEEGKNLAEQLAGRVDLTKLSNSNEIEA